MGERVAKLTVLVNAAAGSVDDAALAADLDAIREAFAAASAGSAPDPEAAGTR